MGACRCMLRSRSGEAKMMEESKNQCESLLSAGSVDEHVSV